MYYTLTTISRLPSDIDQAYLECHICRRVARSVQDTKDRPLRRRNRRLSRLLINAKLHIPNRNPAPTRRQPRPLHMHQRRYTSQCPTRLRRAAQTTNRGPRSNQPSPNRSPLGRRHVYHRSAIPFLARQCTARRLSLLNRSPLGA
jgi:hypothetical protein